eukprot:5949530-Amphidinium_carterae.1
MITKERDGHIKRRLIVDCRESGVNSATTKAERLQLPRPMDVAGDAMSLMEQQSLGEALHWFSIDIANAFYLIPMRREERRHFAVSYK